jgi:hypothetical protein
LIDGIKQEMKNAPLACLTSLGYDPVFSYKCMNLFGFILQLVKFVLSAVDPHEENGSEHSQNHGNNSIHYLSSNPQQRYFLRA